MSSVRIVRGGFALDVGNSKVHGQVRDKRHKLIADWTVPTIEHDSLGEVVLTAYQKAVTILGGPPDFVGFGFGCPVDLATGAAKLTLVPQFEDTVTLQSVGAALADVPVIVHLNDVWASAHALDFPHFDLQTTLLNPGARFEPGQSVLVEIGTGVGTAYTLPGGAALPSEAARIHASNGLPFGLNLCGSQGFINLTKELQAEGVKIPAGITEQLERGETLGPTITANVASAAQDTFTRKFAARYAQYLGEFLGSLQLAFLASRIYVGGSVGRAPMFIEKILETPEFWAAFSKKDALRGKDMPILRVNDTDATVRGAYAAAFRRRMQQS